MDNTVVSLTDFRKKKEEEPAEVDELFQICEVLLDVIDEHFEEGLCVCLSGGEITVSSTLSAVESVEELLEAALYSIRKQSEEESSSEKGE